MPKKLDLTDAEKDSLRQRNVFISFNPWYRDVKIHYRSPNGNFVASQYYVAFEHREGKKAFFAIGFSDGTKFQLVLPTKVRSNSTVEFWFAKIGKGLEWAYFTPDFRQVFFLNLREPGTFQLSKDFEPTFCLRFRKGYEDPFSTCDHSEVKMKPSKFVKKPRSEFFND